MERYSEIIIPYLNTNSELDDVVFNLWSNWSEDGIDMNSAMRDFLRATAISPNIGKLEHYVPHCFQVSRRCEEVGEAVSKHYTFFADELESSKLAFNGLVEDSFKLIGGNGKNNENKEDSNPYHEILTYAQMNHMGLGELAEGMAMHGVAPEILEAEQKKGKFLGISPPKRNIALDILTRIDFLCTKDYLPDTYGSIEDSLDYRVEDIRVRRKDPTHPLIVGLDSGGKERLLELLHRIDKLKKGEIPSEEVREFYGE